MTKREITSMGIQSASTVPQQLLPARIKADLIQHTNQSKSSIKKFISQKRIHILKWRTKHYRHDKL